jgi:hypothetical protein
MRYQALLFVEVNCFAASSGPVNLDDRTPQERSTMENAMKQEAIQA